MSCASSWPIAMGWVPPDQPAGGQKSVTWLECEQAVEEGKEVLAFLFDEVVAWPAEHREEEAIAQAVREGQAITARFTSPDDVRG